MSNYTEIATRIVGDSDPLDVAVGVEADNARLREALNIAYPAIMHMATRQLPEGELQRGRRAEWMIEKAREAYDKLFSLLENNQWAGGPDA